MATFVVGDVHGCFDCFRRLLKRIAFNPKKDRLRLTGDIVNRGPQSLEMLRWAADNRAEMVLGNHDLHLLALHIGAAKMHPRDTVQDILSAPDGDELCAWLRRRPLAIFSDDFLLVHAAVLPPWTRGDVMCLAAAAEAIIGGAQWANFAAQLYGNSPTRWDENLTAAPRFRFILNALTRLRICKADGAMILDFSGAPADIPPDATPWFEVPNRAAADTKIVVGHWSALGVMIKNNVWAIDGGCFWGRKLVALRLDDGAVFWEPM